MVVAIGDSEAGPITPSLYRKGGAYEAYRVVGYGGFSHGRDDADRDSRGHG